MQVFNNGFKQSGIYEIYINSKKVHVYCSMDASGNGWTTFQRRIDGSVEFDRTWQEYKAGFGNAKGEYWLGNEFLHELTKDTTNTKIKISAEAFDRSKVSMIFTGFKVDSETDKYKLHTGTFLAGNESLKDDWLNNNLMSFTTKDNDNDKEENINCGKARASGFWFVKCGKMYVNSQYFTPDNCIFKKGIHFFSWKGFDICLKSVSMSIYRSKHQRNFILIMY